MGKKPVLSERQREAILKLGDRGSDGHFDPHVLSELFSLGLIEVRSEDRRVVLTQQGERACEELTGRDRDEQSPDARNAGG